MICETPGTVAGAGASAAIRCQHIIQTDNGNRGAGPLLHRNRIQFSPGLGIVNRLLLTVEVFGANNVVIVDGHTISYTDGAETKRHSPISVHGVQLHVLKHGQTFNFDQHQAQPQPVSDIPVEGTPNQ